jgi:hypothetical protein
MLLRNMRGLIMSACSESRCGAGTLVGEGRGPVGDGACVREEGGREGEMSWRVDGWAHLELQRVGAAAAGGRSGRWSTRSAPCGRERRPERGAETRLLAAAGGALARGSDG